MSTIVPPHGPLDAQLVWVGECPGYEEEMAGKPFVGASGNEARRALDSEGVDPNSVYWTNCCRVNINPFPPGKRGAEILKNWAHLVDAEMRQLTGAKVVVLCGGVALRRFTGHTSINDHQCSTWRNEDLPEYVTWYEKGKEKVGNPLVLPPGVWVVPVLHPAGILRDPTRTSMVLFRRGVQKAVMGLKGQLTSPTHKFNFLHTPRAVEKAWEVACQSS